MHRNEIKTWTATDGQGQPTWRDGLGESDRTYLIVAVPQVSRSGYKAIVFGRFNGNSGKLKFYPTPEALGVDRRTLRAMNIFGELDRSAQPGAGYVRYFATLEQVKQVLAGLNPEEWMICPADELLPVLTEQRGRDSSRVRHPMDNGFEPKPEVVESEDQGGLAHLAT